MTLEPDPRSAEDSLRAKVEKLEAANAQLQSTNAQLRSTNQELQAVTSEHQRKIADLVELADDMHQLVSSTDLGVVFLDADLRIRKFTEPAAEVFHLLAHDTGRRLEDFKSELAYPSLQEDLRRVRDGGEPLVREVDGKGHKRYLLRMRRHDADGTNRKVLLTLMDVTWIQGMRTERRRLAALVDSSLDAIIGLSVTSEIESWNRGAEELFGWTAQEMIGRSIAVMVPTDRQAELAALHERLRQGEEIDQFETMRLRKDGTTIWVSLRLSPVRDDAGRIVGLSAIDRDITHTKLAEEKLRAGLRAREDFIAMLSHELRNPLAAIVNASGLLGSSAKASSLAKASAIIHRQSNHMARLIDDLSDLARLTRAPLPLRREHVDLTAMATEMAESARAVFDRAKVPFAVHTPPEPVWVLGDPVRLRQVINNLLDNAAKYSPAGKPVDIVVQAEGQTAILSVRDRGIGIAEEDFVTIFEPFAQASVEPTVTRGLGLGLALVRHIVNGHGGSVTVASGGRDRGSEFRVELPVSEPPAKVDDKARQSPPKTGPITVALVEDEPDNRDTFALLLRSVGYRVLSAADGLAGFELIRDQAPQVALLDIGLPKMAGTEVAKRLRACGSTTLLIAVTGYGQKGDRERILAAGFDHHLVKPLDFAVVRELIDRGVQERTAGPDGTAGSSDDADPTSGAATIVPDR